MNLIDTVLIGIISGVIASFCYSVAMMLIRPKIKISDEIAQKDEIYYIKIVNKTVATVTNLQYSLHYCEYHHDGSISIIEIPPRKEPLKIMKKNRFWKKGDTDNAIQITYELDQSKYALDRKEKKLMFDVIGSHVFSGTTTFATKTYTGNDIVQAVFESGNSTKTISISGDR